MHDNVYERIDERYGVSDRGKVYDFNEDKEARLYDQAQDRRMYVYLHGKAVMLSRLIWETFNGPIEGGKYIEYDDGDYHNCSIYNLTLADNDANHRERLAEERRRVLDEALDKGGTFECFLCVGDRQTLMSMESDNPKNLVRNMVVAMESYKELDQDMRWYLTKDGDTLMSGGWEKGKNFYDSRPKRYYDENGDVVFRGGRKETKKKVTVANREVDFHCVCLENGITYNSVSHASREMNIDPCVIKRSAHRKGSVANKDGVRYHFRLIDVKTGEVVPFRSSRSVPHILCVDTGEIFVGQKEVRDVMGFCIHLDKENEFISHGYRWRLATDDEVERLYSVKK